MKKSKKKRFFIERISLLLFLLLLIFVFSNQTKKFVISPVAKQSVAHIALSTPIITASPSPTLTPTPMPLVGFCLRVPILLYHHIQPQSLAKEKSQTSLSVDSGIFDQQMAYLVSRGYTAISASGLVNALRTHSPLFPKSIVLTFDDGYKDIYDYAFPTLKKYNLVGNLMIPTGLMGGSDYLSWGQIEEMARSGLIYFTDHTWSHSLLNKDSVEKIKFEIETAKQQLEEHTGQKIDLFTYPYGSFNGVVEKILQEDGFVGAFSTIPGFTQCDSFIMSLHRNRIGNSSLSAYGL